MSTGTMMLMVLLLVLLGAVPIWSHSRNWVYASMGGFGLVSLIGIVLLVIGWP